MKKGEGGRHRCYLRRLGLDSGLHGSDLPAFNGLTKVYSSREPLLLYTQENSIDPSPSGVPILSSILFITIHLSVGVFLCTYKYLHIHTFSSFLRSMMLSHITETIETEYRNKKAAEAQYFHRAFVRYVPKPFSTMSALCRKPNQRKEQGTKTNCRAKTSASAYQH